MTIIMKSNNEYVTINNAVLCLESFTDVKDNRNLIFKNADDNTIWNVQLSEDIPQNPQYDILMDCVINHNNDEFIGKINLESVYRIINEAAQICTFFALGGTLETLEQ